LGDLYDAIPDDLARFIEAQHVFFVATAPLAEDGRVNVSPKGLDTLRILSPNRVAYLDLTGSGNETSAHMAENGRVTFMFCAFEGPAKILRLYGRGRTVLPDTSEWTELLPRFETMPGMRQIVVADIDRVSTSCGYAVPLLEFKKDRPTLPKWSVSKGETWLEEYRREMNAESIDGIPTPLGRHFEAAT
jgi:Pyridoxamine 5'-phosphate oxidase